MGAAHTNKRASARKVGVRRAHIVAVVAVVAAIALAVPPAMASGIVRLGELPRPSAAPDTSFVSPTFTDFPNRKMYAVYNDDETNRVVEYDLTVAGIPRLLRDVPLKLNYTVSAATVAVDSVRKRAYYLDYADEAEHCFLCVVVRQMDLQSMRSNPAVWNLAQRIPNFYAQGITYSPADGRLYVIGASTGGPTFFFDLLNVPAYPATAAALDAETGQVEWSLPVPQCQHPMNTFAMGAAIFRAARPHLYFACVRADAPFGGLANYPGQSGLIRLTIAPEATQGDAEQFKTEFFAISGTYTSGKGVEGLAVFDYVTDRMFILSQSLRTPGAWVFDGRLSAWVGFVPAYDYRNTAMGLDQGNGRLYMKAGEDRGVVVADGRSTPVAQGIVAPYQPFNGFLQVDPVSHRVFLPAVVDQRNATLVLKDQLGEPERPVPVDYDDQTTDVAEGPSTVVAYAGSANGFGAWAMMVGGTGGVATATGNFLPTLSLPPVWDRGNVFGVSPSDRGIFLGRVGSIDLRNSGAAAGAQAVAPDARTSDEYETLQRDTLRRAGDPSEPQPWPWDPSVCLDGGERRRHVTHSLAAGESTVSCDLAKERASAAASVGSASIGSVTVGSGSFVAETHRDSGDGIVATGTAVAREVRISIPGTATLSIGRVEAEVRTAAQGRPETAQASYHRTIEGVSLRGPSGKELFGCVKQCDLETVESEVNRYLSNKLRLRFPDPDIRETPRGAFAAVQEQVADYVNGLTVNNDDVRAIPAVQVELFNDYGEKSRLFVQLAGAQASSIYGISPIGPESSVQVQPSERPNRSTAPFGETPVVSAPPPGAGGPVAGLQEPPEIVSRIVRSALLLVRSPKEAFLVGLLLMLFGGCAGIAWRRRALVRDLTGG